MSYELHRVSDEEKYFFDLRGYLVVPGALSPQEIDEANAALDAKMSLARNLAVGSLSRGAQALSGDSSRIELTGMLGWEPEYRIPFRKMLAHPVVVSRLNEFSGRGFRLDHGPLLISAKKGAEGHTLHGQGEPFEQSVLYHQQNGRIFCRGITVAWQLADCNAGDGGFAIVPGSHKLSEPTPREVRILEDDLGVVEQVPMKAGDLLFFAETATHGTLPWTADHDRRSVLYKYASRGAARAVGKYFTPQERYGDWTNELTPEQQAVLYGPGVHHGGRLPILDSDGKKTWVVPKDE
ncbi:MAG: phytanoyl-CoA dioxygenase family protein [Candidatus Poribacteria bacterium]|nr:phytanoyl-CoA dioxygenase family protein [Candidatus Poribacteria bacterium]